MRKKLLLVTVASLLLAGCGGGGQASSSSQTPSSSSSQSQVTKYTVTFSGVEMPSVQIEEGKQLSKPADPSKDGYIFVGWYLDSAFTQEANFPLTINKDTTVYAQFYSHREAFAKARKNTIGEDVAGYEYDYTLAVTAGYMGVSFAGNTSGNAKYNKNSSDVKFYDEHSNSGALFYDGTKYEILKGGSLHSVSLDENGVVKKYSIKEVGSAYQYDSSSFAKAVFEYDESKLKSIHQTNVPNEYKLDTGFNASAGIALVGNYVNHPMVEKIIGSLPETDVDTGMYVTFSGDKLNSYRYEMAIDVAGVKFNLTYSLTFKNAGKAPTISPKVFNDTYISNADIASAKTEIDGYLDAYKKLEHSSYDFLVKTAVDYEKKNAINATIDGFTKRKVSGGVSYYLNDYEVDSDHKNADLYKEKGLGDSHGARVKLSTGEVHDLKKKAVLSGYSDVATVTHEGKDDYYLLDVLSEIEHISFIQKISDSKNNKVTYVIGGDDASAIEVLDFFNDGLRLNPLGECSVDVKAFGSFEDASVKVKDFEFNIVVAGGALSEINLSLNGAFVASFPESRDFESAADAGFKLTYKLTVTDKGATYEPAAEVSKVK